PAKKPTAERPPTVVTRTAKAVVRIETDRVAFALTKRLVLPGRDRGGHRAARGTGRCWGRPWRPSWQWRRFGHGAAWTTPRRPLAKTKWRPIWLNHEKKPIDYLT